MIGHIIVSILSIFISIGILKNIEVHEFYRDPWKPFDLRVWHVILICIFGIIPIINISLTCGLSAFVIVGINNDDYRLKHTSLMNKIIKFLNKSI